MTTMKSNHSLYRIPVGRHRIEIEVSNSRFITTIAHATSVEQAKLFVSEVRTEMPTASHHVYAFRIGFGNSVTEGMSDDGEPSGTAGPPTLAVLRGTDIGDIALVTTRYFGGTKLGTGGLVRAYGEAAKMGLSTLKTEIETPKQVLGVDISYTYYYQIKRLVAHHEGVIQEETFGSNISIIATFPITHISGFEMSVTELTAGQVTLITLSDE